MKLPSYLDYDKDTIKRLRTQKIFRYGDVERFDKELDYLMSFKDELIKDFFAEYDNIEDCLNRGEKQTYVITGFGMIQKELPLWCEQNAAIRKIENPKNNLGAYHIYFFKK